MLVCILVRERNGEDLGGVVGRSGRGETGIRIYYMNKSIFNENKDVCVSVMLPSSGLPGTYPELRRFRAESVFNDEASGFQVHIKDKDQ